ncbi:alkene reductase [Tunicatimonas pelagia]|uniref:alkene reductase n=1 Tax=Tunicatimonas pelagia TaxID=931531 RepID=UPI002666FE45|nr:alkene reductase [Tunicatimonas pelagia]WKN41376.1 alkene reductase [Tunicatimonas pelagia]
MLFESFTLGNIELQNRAVMAPLTRNRATNNIPNDLMAEYYGQRSGAGLIITEGTAPSPNALGYPRIPGAFSAEQTEGWKKVTQAVHQGGAKMFMQLMHTGRVGHPYNLPEGAEVVGTTTTPVQGEMYTDEKGPQPYPAARLMNESDIQAAMQSYVTSAKNAIEAGFDGVELHAANGYLIEQFLNANVNVLDNDYNGSHEARSKFALEVAQAVINAIGAERTGIRLSPYGVFNDTGAFEGIEEAYEYLAQELGKLNLAYTHIVDHSPMGAPEVPRSIKEKIRDAFGGTIIISGGYDHERAEQDLQDGLGHLVAFGRPFLANPDLVHRMKEGAELQQPNQDTFYTPGPEGYTDYPTLEEAEATE